MYVNMFLFNLDNRQMPKLVALFQLSCSSLSVQTCQVIRCSLPNVQQYSVELMVRDAFAIQFTSLAEHADEFNLYLISLCKQQSLESFSI